MQTAVLVHARAAANKTSALPRAACVRARPRSNYPPKISGAMRLQQGRSIEGAPKATADAGAGSAPGRPQAQHGGAPVSPAWAPSSTVWIVRPAAPAGTAPGGGGNGDGKGGKSASGAETPTATPAVTPRESVESTENTAVPAVGGTAVGGTAGAAAAAVEVVEGSGSGGRPERTAAAAGVGAATKERESTKGAGAAVGGGADRAAGAEALAEGLQAQLADMEVGRSRLGRI